MKIGLIGINSKFIHKNLAIYSIYSFIKGELKDIEVKVMEFSINEPMDKIFYSLNREKFDILAFNVYLWNKDLVLNLIDSLKKINLNLKAVAGGPEISEDYLRYESIDYLIVGEGEATFKKLLESSFNLKERFFKNEGESIDLNKLPFVYEDFLPELKNKIIYYEGSRGCPFKCSYCLSGMDNQLRLKKPKKIFSEIKALVENGAKQIKFIDRTFNANVNWSLEIIEYLQSLKDHSCNFHFEVSVDKMDEKLIAALKNSPDKLFQLEVGIQTTNEETLKAIRRGNNLSKIREGCRSFIEGGNIHIHTDLIAGLPFEGYESFKKSFNEVFYLKSHMLKVGFLKVIPNTKMFAEADIYNIKYQSSPPYEVIATDWITSGELLNIKYVEEAIEIFYNTSYFRQTFNYLEECIKNYFNFFLFLGKKLYFKNDLLSLSGKYDFLYANILEYLNYDADENLKGALKLDWYLNLKDKKKPKIFSDEDQVDIIRYVDKKAGFNSYKAVDLPFLIELKGVDYKFIKNNEINRYLFDYSVKKTIYDYPQLTLLDKEA